MKEGLTSEEYLNKLDKTKWADMLKVAMEVRQFEISLYWKRANEPLGRRTLRHFEEWTISSLQ